MRPAIRIGAVNAQVTRQTSSRSGFVCLQCRQRASETSQLLPQASFALRRHVSGNFTDGLRKRIWGENPPGQEDPYGPKTPRDVAKEQEAAEAEAEARSERIANTKPRISTPKGWDLGEDYVPATSITELARLPPAHEMAPFQGFMASSILKAREEIFAAVHRALIEIYTLHEANMPLVVKSDRDEDPPELSGVAFSPQDANGHVTLSFTDEQLRETVLMSVSRPEPEEERLPMYTEEGVLEVEEQETEQANDDADASVLESESAQNLDLETDFQVEVQKPNLLEAASKDTSWRYIRFDDPDLKFAILKRVMQLTGTRIPDPAIDGIKSTNGLLGHLIKKPKPKKLAETLTLSEKLQSLPNLQIMDRRYTPIDKEKELGRWKVIEKELRQRGLPVTGHL